MKQDIAHQYKTPENLNARANLHARFSTNPMGWLPWVFDHIRERLPENARILETGCGPGALWEENRRRIPAGWKLTLTDFSEGMVARAREAMADASLDAEWAQAAAQDLPFAPESFDAVIANHMLYHVPDIDRGLGEIKRVLKPEGTLFASTIGAGHMQELYDLFQAYNSASKAARDIFPLRFGLESGREILARHFASVERIDYVCDLRVDEAGPLADYVCSMAGMGIGIEPIIREREQFKSFLETLIREKGSIHISKRTGILIAR